MAFTNLPAMAGGEGPQPPAPAASEPAPADGIANGSELQRRLDRALDRWCRWLAGYLYQVPGTDLYTMAPTLGTGANPYRDVAGNQFAAAAAAYWLGRTEVDEVTARPLKGLIKLALGTHVAVKAIDRRDVQKWGAGFSQADDWHASLFAGAWGMLMPASLTPEQSEQLRTILAWEADKHVEYGIAKKWRSLPGRYPAGSCGESNAWTTLLLQAARAAHPNSSRDAAWRNAAIDFSLNAICTPADMVSEEVLAGVPIKSRVRGANFEPGGIQEHHGFYHPGYIAWPLAYQAFAFLLEDGRPGGERMAEVHLHNWRPVFDRLKQATFANGRFIYCAGDDWNTYGYGNSYILPVALFAAAQFGDSDAARLADEWLTLIERQQEMAGGAVQIARLGTLQRLRLNDVAWYEAIDGCALAQAIWTLERVGAEKVPAPSSERDYNRRQTGTYHEPNAGLIWTRDERRWASFATRAAFGEWQALVQPIGLPHLLKFNHNSTGLIEAAGTTDRIRVVSTNMKPLEGGGFWAVGAFDRLSKNSVQGAVFPMVRQEQALVVLPDGPALLIDCCQALDQLWLLRSGSLGLRLAADVFNEGRVKIAASGLEQVFGQHPERDTWHDLGTCSVTIENQLTVRALAGEGSFQLLQKRRRPADRSEMLYANDRVGAHESLLAHELYFGPPAFQRPRVIAPEERFRELVLAIDCDPRHATAEPAIRVSGRHPALCIHLPDGGILAVNLADKPSTVDAPSGGVTVGPRSVLRVK